MIHKDTVLVLGAGASVPYGFPLGAELARQICHELRNDTPLRRFLLRESITDHQIQRFYTDYLRSARRSLDAFVEGRPDRPEFLRIAKLAIAFTLLPCESDVSILRLPQRLRDPEPALNDDWMAYLIPELLGRNQEDFSSNKLQVITFNFDRSFERRLFLAVESAYGLSSAAAADLVVATMPVLHINGRLGAPDWLPQRSPGEAVRGYESPKGKEHDPDFRRGVAARECAEGIRIVHEPGERAALTMARTWTEQADRVWFVGFSFHPSNVERVGYCDGPTERSVTQQVRGTSLGIPDGDIPRVKDLFQNGITLDPVDALQFFKRNPEVHG